MIGGDARLQAVRTPGVLGDIAADGTCGLARGIRDVLQAVRQDRLGKAGVHHPRLDHRAPGLRVNAEDPVEPGECHEDGVALGERTATEAGAGTPGDEWCSRRMQLSYHRDELITRSGQDHHARIRLVGGQPIHGIGSELGLAMPHPAGANDGRETREEGLVHESAR